MAVGVRVRIADFVRKRAKIFEIAAMSPEQILAAQNRHSGHNWFSDRVFGAMAKGVCTRQHTIGVRSGSLTVRIYTPNGRTTHGTVVNFHGGGWVLGDLDGNDWTCSNVAARVGARVVSVDYRLAPAHRFPAGVQDCFDALQWAAETTGPLAVMGDSAGGNLAAVMAQLSRDNGGPELAQQVLIYPATDLTMGSPSLQTNAEAPILNRASIDAYRRHYLGSDEDSARNPLVSPLLAESLAGLAPALIITAEHDPVRDDGRRYAAALRAAGVPVRRTDYVDEVHGFVSIPGLTPMAKQALNEICTELSAAFTAPGSRAGHHGR